MLNHDVCQHDASDSLIDVLIYVVYDVDVVDGDIVVADIYVVYDVRM